MLCSVVWLTKLAIAMVVASEGFSGEESVPGLGKG